MTECITAPEFIRRYFNLVLRPQVSPDTPHMVVAAPLLAHLVMTLSTLVDMRQEERLVLSVISVEVVNAVMTAAPIKSIGEVLDQAEENAVRVMQHYCSLGPAVLDLNTLPIGGHA